MNTSAVPRNASPLAATLAAALILAVAMGFGRFAFTGMYPLMVRDGVLSIGAGSLAASLNYAGYLAGALLLSGVAPARSTVLCKIALAATALLLAALAFDGGPWFVIAVRFAAGVVSAIAMVAASTWLFQVIDNPNGAPLLYAGVGVGILLSAELIGAGNLFALGSGGLWLLLAVASGVLCVLAWPCLRRRNDCPTPPAAAYSAGGSEAHAGPGPWTLILAYGLAGFGYIVTATYLPLLVRNAVGNIDPIHIWAAFGLGAAPSCFLWHALHLRCGTRRALALNLAVQAAGVVLPVLSHSPLSFLCSAVLVGGTFTGTVTIAMPAARRAADALRFNILGMMTASYGIGQIVGPLISGVLYARSGSFDQPLLAACAALLIAVALTLGQRQGRH
jgi:predicted MFS family arabinose efflux permease